MGLHVRRSVPRVLLLMAGSVVLPGMAHLAAGRRRAGLAIGGVAFALLVAAVVYLHGTSRREIMRHVVEPGLLAWVSVGALALAAAWIAVVISSCRVLRPIRTGTTGRLVISATATLLCVLVAIPPLVAARYAYVQRGLILDVFPNDPGALDGQSSGSDPWGGRQRLNVLLIASDAGPDRTGVRTDSLVLASMDVHTGHVVLFSLPRNLEHVPMPPGPLHDTWPNGFPDLLNAVYQHVTEHPGLLADARDRGAEGVKRVVSEILGVPVDYYAMANLQGFSDFVDALGGVWVNVQYRLPIGGILADGSYVPPIAYIEPGRQRLDGYHALWYARSRRDSSDYVRIGRQRCLIGAMVKQANPTTVLKNFQKLASATKRLLETDIPRNILGNLVDLTDKVRSEGQIRSLPFVPPLINTANPDFASIRASVRKAIAADAEATTHPTHTSASPKPPVERGSGDTGRAAQAATPTTAQAINEVCNLS